MKTIIWDDDRMLEAPVADAARQAILDEPLQPLTEAEYRDGPAVLLTTEARFAYVVDDDEVRWVVEWPPGVVIVRFGADGSYAAARVPVDDDEHPFVELVTVPWAAQLDEDDRDEAGFVPADPATRASWEAATAAVQRLGEQMSADLDDDSAVQAWRERAEDSPWVRER